MKLPNFDAIRKQTKAEWIANVKQGIAESGARRRRYSTKGVLAHHGVDFSNMTKKQMADALKAISEQKAHDRRISTAGVKRLHAARRYEAKPLWADDSAITAIYAEAKAMTLLTGIPHEVDHVLPLLGKDVSGLHVETNLRVVTRTENRRKSNRS
jgi:hypothetical protein